MTRSAGRILVTGSAGFVGTALKKVGGPNVVGVTRRDADLSDPKAIADLCAELQPESIIHLAAAGVARRAADSLGVVGINVEMTANVVNAAPPDCRVLIAGSMSEYGRGGILSEDGRCTPSTAYGISKLAASLFALAYPKGHEILVARLFGVFGCGEPADRLFPSLISRLGEGKPVPLSDGQQLRDFVHVDDAARTLLSLCASPIPPQRIVNVGTGVAVRVRDAALWIAQGLSADPTLLRFGARSRSPGDEDALIADVTLLESVTGSVPPQRLEVGLDLDMFGACSARSHSSFG